MEKYILAVDQGTTTTTCMLVDKKLDIIAKSSREFAQYYPQPGWVEHDLEEIWNVTQQTMQELLHTQNIAGEQIAAIGITNQRETTGIWDSESGKPLHNAIVWQCRRTVEKCQELKEAGHEALFRDRTGLVLDAYFSGTKLNWLLDQVDDARSKAKQGKIKFGTIDTFLVDRMTAGKEHVTDVSNAARTLMFNIHKLAWDDELISILDLESQVLPRVASSSEIYGYTEGMTTLPDGIPIAGMAGDQQAALFGQVCFEPGMVKATYGTGSFVLMNTGQEAVKSENGLLTTVAWKIGDEVVYALEGSAFIAGAMVQWLRDGLGLIKTAPEIEALATQVDDSGGVVVVPALAGLGAPHWRPNARGAIMGLTRGSTAAHVARATLEGLALQNRDLIVAMAGDAKQDIQLVRVDGGAAENDFLMQFQADILNAPISRPKALETTALGAAALAGLAVGFYADLEEVRRSWSEQQQFKAKMEENKRKKFVSAWQDAIGRIS